MKNAKGYLKLVITMIAKKHLKKLIQDLNQISKVKAYLNSVALSCDKNIIHDDSR